MAEKEEIFKAIILSLFFLFGCSYNCINVEGESLGGKIVDSWEELDCKIVEQDEQGFSLGVEVGNIVAVGIL